MKLSNILIGILLVSATIFGFNLLIVEMSGNYGASLDNDTWAESYDVLEDIQGLESGGKNMGEIITEEDPKPSVLTPFYKISSAIRMVGGSVSMLGKMVVEFVGGTLGANPYVSAVIITIISIIVLFAIASTLWKWNM
tara:strand:- start:1949 stop:2362 length:414 start_codon:yes stop_codon:yes gene_type:complete